jgi:hypothetical protein
VSSESESESERGWTLFKILNKTSCVPLYILLYHYTSYSYLYFRLDRHAAHLHTKKKKRWQKNKHRQQQRDGIRQLWRPP